MKDLLVIGVGNTLRGDDGAGIRVVEQIRRSPDAPECLTVHQLTPELADTIRLHARVCFVDASIAGWKAYVSGSVAQRAAADARMRQDNPEMKQAELLASHALMVGQGLVGDVATLGRLRLAQVDGFLQDMVKAGLYKPGEVKLAQVASERFTG